MYSKSAAGLTCTGFTDWRTASVTGRRIETVIAGFRAWRAAARTPPCPRVSWCSIFVTKRDDACWSTTEHHDGNDTSQAVNIASWRRNTLIQRGLETGPPPGSRADLVRKTAAARSRGEHHQRSFHPQPLTAVFEDSRWPGSSPCRFPVRRRAEYAACDAAVQPRPTAAGRRQ